MVTFVAGGLIFAIGAVTLFLVFRRYEGAQAGGRSHMVLIASLVGFVLLACLALFALSYSPW